MGYHGKPDWGLQVKKTVYTFDDLSELAVRLGSIDFFDRRGDVYFLDNFKNGLGKWELDGSGDDNAQEITADRSRSGGYSLKLTGGSTTPYLARMTSYFPYPILSKWGVEVHFCLTPSLDKIYFDFIMDNGSRIKTASVKYDKTNKKLQCQKEGIGYHDIETSFELPETDYLFHVLKLVADLETSKHHRLILDETEYDISDYDMHDDGPTSLKRLKTRISLYSRDNFNDVVYIDNVIITQNEP